MSMKPRTTDTQWRHKSKMSEKLSRCGRQSMLWLYLKIWDWNWIFGHAVKAISSLGILSPCSEELSGNAISSNMQGPAYILKIGLSSWTILPSGCGYLWTILGLFVAEWRHFRLGFLLARIAGWFEFWKLDAHKQAICILYSQAERVLGKTHA